MTRQKITACMPVRIVKVSSIRLGSSLMLAGVLAGVFAGVLDGIGIIGAAHAHTLPEGLTLRAGAIISVAQDDFSALTIFQSSKTAVIDWTSFNIGERSCVLVNQPSADALLLNRVVGDGPSVLAGSLIARGNVVLMNPNGIAITPTGKIMAAGFLASTLPLDDAVLDGILRPGSPADLYSDMRRLLAVRPPGAGTGEASVAAQHAVMGRNRSVRTPQSIKHEGTIHLSEGGTAALLGVRVDASGEIVSPGGRIAIVAAEPVAAQSVTAQPVTAQSVTAQSATQALSPAVQMRGTYQTSGHAGRRGQILIAAEGKSMTVNGAFEADSVGGSGGSIALLAADITTNDATLSVVGSHGGGDITLSTGATAPGKAHIAINDLSLLFADATDWGNGGNIAISTMGDIHFNATAHAKGERDAESVAFVPMRRSDRVEGARGNGGERAAGGGGVIRFHAGTGLAVRGDIDTSHKENAPAGRVEFRTAAVRVANWNGTRAGSPVDGAADRVRGVSATSSDTGSDIGSIAAHAAGVPRENVIDASTLSRSLKTANVVLSSDVDDGTSFAGDHEVQAPVRWSSDNALVMHSVNNIRIHAPVHATGQHASVHFTMGNPVGLSFTGGAVALMGAMSFVSINGHFYNMIRSPEGMTEALSKGDKGRYAMAMPINLAGVDFQPIVTPQGQYFSHFEGLGNALSNLRIHAPTVQNVGLFGTLGDTAHVSNVVFSNAHVSGAENVGILTGVMEGRSVARALTFMCSSATRDLAASLGARANLPGTGGAVGGVAGILREQGLVHAIDGKVHVQGDDNVGGIVGTMATTSGIDSILLRGTVTGTRHVGGFVGKMSANGLVQNSIWHGAVRGTPLVHDRSGAFGGLVGYHQAGTVSASQAYGTVTGLAGVGGLVGMAGENAVLLNCRAGNQVDGKRFVGKVAGRLAEGAKVALIDIANADPRFPNVGTLPSYAAHSGADMAAHLASPSAAQSRGIVPNDPLGYIPSIIRSAEVDAQYIPALVSRPASPVVWLAGTPRIFGAPMMIDAESLPILASPATSPHSREAISADVAQWLSDTLPPLDLTMSNASEVIAPDTLSSPGPHDMFNRTFDFSADMS